MTQMLNSNFPLIVPIQVLGLAAIYFVLGLAGVELAPPQNYSTAIFPASGIAVSAILYGGIRLLPGVWLGSFLLNLWIVGSTEALELQHVFMALLIGIGASIQALVAFYLLKSFQTNSKTLATLQKIVLFLIILAPLANLISSTWGCITLYVFDIISAEHFASNWLTWWIGDSIGVLLFYPITLTLLFREQPFARSIMRTVMLPTLITLLMVFIVFIYVAKIESRQLKIQMQNTGLEIEHNIKSKLNVFTETLFSLSSLMQIYPELSHTKFQSYTRNLLSLNPDLYGISWNRYLSAPERANFENQLAKHLNIPTFQITEKDVQGNLIRAKNRDHYTPVTYISPFDSNKQALGFDIASDSVRLKAITQVLHTGQLAITSPIKLVQETGDSASILIIAPVTTIKDNIQSEVISGFTVAVVRIESMMKSLLSQGLMKNVEIQIKDKYAPITEVTLFRSHLNTTSRYLKYLWQSDINVGGRTWQLTIIPTTHYIDGHVTSFAWKMLLIGLVFSGLLQVLLLAITSQHYFAKTALQQSESNIRSILDNSPFLIWHKDTKGQYLNINKKYADLIGLSDSNQIIGKTDYDIWPKELAEHYLVDDEEVLSFQKTKHIQQESVIVGGQVRYNETFKSPLFDSLGQLIGTIGFSHDISERIETYKQLAESELRFRELFQQTPIAYQSLDADGRFIDVNEQFCNMIGFSREEILGTTFGEIWIDEIQDQFPCKFKEFKKTGNANTQLKLEGRDGRIIDVILHGRVQRDGKGNFVRTHCVLFDITEHEKLAEEIRIAAIAFESQEGMFVTDSQGLILRANKSFSAITGYDMIDVIGKNPRMFSSGRHDAKFYSTMWKSINKNGIWQGEIWNKRKNGQIYPQKLTITAVMNTQHQITNYVATFTDITSQKTAEEEIHLLAFYDPLTKLPNRRLFMDRLSQALASCARTKKIGALMYLDIDNFKILNDTLGHEHGDFLLQMVASRLQETVREHDTVARLGGDEFVVLLEYLDKNIDKATEDTINVANEILSSLNQVYQLATNEYHGTCSIGVIIFNEDDVSPEKLIKHADIAMYQAKHDGRNAICIFNPKMQEQINARSTLEADIRKAISDQQFQLYYQVQVDKSNRPFGAEALIRWHHPEHGFVSPIEFIPVAEETGLIIPIGEWVLNSACAQLKLWQQQEHMSDLILSINVSAKQFHSANFAKQVQSTIEQYDIVPQRLKIELTESMLVNNLDVTINTMLSLKTIGVKFSLDDFGTGYSSLQYLKRLPLDQLKIDQSFVRELVVDDNDRAIVRTIIAMANSLNLDIIAEGVETEEQRDILLAEGCSHFQGYLFSKPIPIDEFEDIVNSCTGKQKLVTIANHG